VGGWIPTTCSSDDSVTTLIAEKPKRARTLIEDFMIAANGTIARFLEAIGSPCSGASSARPSAGSGSPPSRPSSASGSRASPTRSPCDPPVGGRLERGQEGLDVGDRVRVRLVHTNPERGFIDFHPVGR
jgi:exoribonuclease R